MNGLAASSSPYLLQHSDNPVDWVEWSETAFAEARRRDVPVLLSVGYAACHWCHVMAHESFEDESIAARINAGFVAIKVDREERPDVDAVYMDATVAMTGQGGWPMTCLLDHDGQPFFCGTYFPPAQFRQLLDAAGEAWAERRGDLLDTGSRVAAALAQRRDADGGVDLGGGALDAAVTALLEQADTAHGGFGRAPKFPPSMAIEFLLRHHERTGDIAALDAAEQALVAMARGGIYDQLAGGFARYAVDAGWVVPHFEKMLYDNALLLRAYLHWWRLTGRPLAERVARETADFLLRDLRTTEGGFASSLDADTDGVEGLTYVWTPSQLDEVLGADAAPTAALFVVTPEGTFEHGASTLQLPADPPERSAFDATRARLLAARDRRPQPGRDDKIVTAWNGLAVAALAEAATVLEEPRYLAAARDCATLLLDVHLVDGRLRRTSRGGVVGGPAGVLEDYADLADGLLTLHEATADPRWLEASRALLTTVHDRFADGRGGYFDTADDAAPLLRRPQDPTDNAAPSGASAVARALLSLSALTGDVDARDAAERALATVAGAAVAQPRFFGWWLATAEALLDGPVQVAVVGEDGDGPLTATARRRRPPGAVVLSAAPDTTGLALLAGRPLVAGAAAAYVCRGMVCDLPVTSVEALAAQLTGTART